MPVKRMWTNGPLRNYTVTDTGREERGTYVCDLCGKNCDMGIYGPLAGEHRWLCGVCREDAKKAQAAGTVAAAD